MPSALPKIEHIVVLMMENRSFDHLLGYLKVEHRKAIDGLVGDEINPDGTGAPVRVHSAPITRFPSDLGHTFGDVAAQLAGVNQGFVTNYLAQKAHGAGVGGPMQYHDEAHVWAYHHLQRDFVVCDRWFSSLPGPTIPNRLFAVTGQSGGNKDNPKAGIKIYAGLRSIFDCLDAGLKDRQPDERWTYFYHDLPLIALLKQHVDNYIFGKRVKKIGDFWKRAKNGTLPAVSWIDPNFADIGASNDDHPPKSDLYDGQSLVATVYNALVAGGNDLWSKTLLVVTYDEHGGFFDHVSPPATGDAAPFNRFGVRVPALVISPWTEAGAVDSIERDHTSILTTVLERFAPEERLTPRVSRANSLANLLTRTTPRMPTGIVVPGRPGGLAALRAATVALKRLPPSPDDQLLDRYKAEFERRKKAAERKKASARKRGGRG